MMDNHHQARWISRPRLNILRKTGRLGAAVMLESFNGYLIIEPIGAELGDGEIMSTETADYELQPVWCTGDKVRLREARKRLGLETDSMAGAAQMAALR